MSPAPPPSARRAQQGIAILWAIAGLLIIVGTALVGLQRISAREGRGDAEFQQNSQAMLVAQAGLDDAHAWLRRQGSQPVTAFEPVLDETGTPPSDETDDPSLGLVRSYDIGGGLWARYEIRRGRPADPFTDENGNGLFDEGESFTDLLHPGGGGVDGTGYGEISDGYGDGARTPAMWTRDIALERGLVTPGAVWRLESRGIVYRRPRSDLAPGVGPNRIVATAVLATEVRRFTVQPPASAAICTSSASGVSLLGYTRLEAEHVAIALGSGSATVMTAPTATIDAPVPNAVPPDYADDLEAVFGVDWIQLQSMADLSTSAAIGGLPDPIADGSLVVFEGDLVCTSLQPLHGRGALVVRGDLRIKAGSGSSFTGLIYVDGEVTIAAPMALDGALIATGSVALGAKGTPRVEIVHRAEILQNLLVTLGQYRITRARYAPDAGFLDPVPHDGGNPADWPPAPPASGSGAWGHWGGWAPSGP